MALTNRCPTRPISFLPAILLLGSGNASATSVPVPNADPGGTNGKDLQALISKAVIRAYDLEAQVLEKEKTANDRISAWTSLLPTLNLSAGRTITNTGSVTAGIEESTQSQSNSFSLKADWTLWNNYQNVRNIRVAELNSRVQEIDSDLELQTFILDAITKYLDLQVLYEQRRAIQEVLESAREFAKEASEMASLGARTRLDVMDTEIQLRNFENDSQELENQIRIAERDLRVTLNEDEQTSFSKSDLLKSPPYYMIRFESELPRLQEALKNQFSLTSPRIQSANLKLDRTLETYSQTWLQYLPSVNLTMSQDWNFGNFVTANVEVENQKVIPSSSATLTFSWTVWDWLGTHRGIQNSKKDLEIQRIALTKSTRQVKYEVLGLIEQYETALKNIESSEMVVRQAELQQDYSRSMYQLGRISLLQAQTATQRLSQARISLIQRLRSKFLLAARMLIESDRHLLPPNVDSSLARPHASAGL